MFSTKIIELFLGFAVIFIILLILLAYEFNSLFEQERIQQEQNKRSVHLTGLQTTRLSNTDNEDDFTTTSGDEHLNISAKVFETDENFGLYTLRGIVTEKNKDINAPGDMLYLLIRNDSTFRSFDFI